MQRLWSHTTLTSSPLPSFSPSFTTPSSLSSPPFAVSPHPQRSHHHYAVTLLTTSQPHYFHHPPHPPAITQPSSPSSPPTSHTTPTISLSYQIDKIHSRVFLLDRYDNWRLAPDIQKTDATTKSQCPIRKVGCFLASMSKSFKLDAPWTHPLSIINYV